MARRSPKSGGDVPFTTVAARFLRDVLRPDLRKRAEEPAVADLLRAQYAALKAAGRTGEREDEFREYALEQVGAAWLLSTLFVRVLEDRGLVAERRIAGLGADDNQHLFGELFPGLGPRDYVLTAFREVAHLPGGAEVLGPATNPAWRLGPSHDAVRAMLDLFREADAQGTLRWRFEARDTRLLGDLYEQLSEGVQERFALLQTPDFVERFLLDRTLSPAIEAFGLDAVNVIDPTCGSGHLVLGAFWRLFEATRKAHPDLDARAAATRALAKVHGSDVNPYAVAIARFRLALAVVDACGVAQLRDLPRGDDDRALDALRTNLVVADSLIVGGASGQGELASQAKSRDDQRSWGTPGFDFEDPEAVKALFAKDFHAVVGNPPYKTCRDAALRDGYRARYPDSAKGLFTLSAPFTERFFQLATDGGFVGLINSNAFMKREFGKGLIEKVLPRYDLTTVVDSSGAYIPGHDTPTVLLFGRRRAPACDGVCVVMGRKGEPGTPTDPAKGKVWSSIVANVGNVSFENEFVTVSDVPRSTLAIHPWSLGGGGAGELQTWIEGACGAVLEKVIDGAIGFAAITGEDNVFLLEPGGARRNGLLLAHSRAFAAGEVIRDWACAPDSHVVWPCNAAGQRLAQHEIEDVLRFFWPVRMSLKDRKAFSVPIEARGIPWWAIREVYQDRFRTPLTIAFAFVATHNHFVLDRGATVFNRTSPVIKLSATATEDDYLALLAWLNSSAACFWMKRVFYPKATTNKDVNLDRGDPSTNRYEFAGTAMLPLPVPASASVAGDRHTLLIALTREIEALSTARAAAEPSVALAAWTPDRGVSLKDALRDAQREGDRAFRQMVVLQEELDWLFYEELGLCEGISVVRGEASPEERPFAWEGDEAPASLDPSLREEWTRRRRMLVADARLRMLEDPMYKRPWEGRRGVFGHGALTWDERVIAACKEWLLDQIEAVLSQSEAAMSMAEAETALLRQPKALAVLDLLAPTMGYNVVALLSTLANENALPYLAAMRHTEEGLAKRAQWERTWDLQRREDAGETLDAPIPVPPKYDREDYRDARFWSLRGKLDVPRERFIAYPGAETDPKAPLFGWAGWDHLQRARALARLYTERKDADSWDRDRLRPLLAGLAELVPWLLQWHDAPDPELDGQGQGGIWREFVDNERHALKWSVDELRAWRPAVAKREPAKRTASRAKKAAPDAT